MGFGVEVEDLILCEAERLSSPRSAGPIAFSYTRWGLQRYFVATTEDFNYTDGSSEAVKAVHAKLAARNFN